jgi:hypothetical protein
VYCLHHQDDEKGMRKRIAGYIGVGGPSKLGPTNGEWVMTGEKAGQWQMGAEISQTSE